ncbi:pyridoxine/pyridoxamine 5'-phosphate oxidase [Mobilicoccus caccae]|uniref:Pyridoxamine 5'-phosphate oxidase n=1 Tax=Mobilicoccus caccae TaxID=1859295 RepID=A0ABQ6INY0_9MICO|nr:pyridoxamine 5'-phosphate oxidase family protein [Mobilicoccus caccae]GMA38791.1 pyridoxamine 5'-phosphate oxidase [Mobilicoccus caccae]
MTDDVRRRLAAIPALTGTPPTLDLERLPAEPTALFLDWLEDAVTAGVPEPRTTTLATADADGIPDARLLILKDVGERGWAFASTASSRKGEQLADNPAAALSFWWQPLTRAVRVRGRAVEGTPEESAADLAARSPQAQSLVADGDWRLWWVRPDRIEFWQGSPDRKHLRIVYTRTDDTWSREILTADGS